ncbi:lipid II-degrading bacteriocin [Pantoea sp. GD03673]|uniref:lipid II-degrading bacteriocin n=1 Tax=Pantoea sp. GD03673 TaxID=2975364 RepID=UPI00244CA857|nr:lipid II-degrading bacteriocin [Pantoea sp. GD03673]MDH2066878.1 lipid II-degrading bacteriocin [Pantoea sp. GD03673]
MADMVVVSPPVVTTGSSSVMYPGGRGGNVASGGPPHNVRYAVELHSGSYHKNATPLIAKDLKSNLSESKKLENAMWWFKNCVFINMCETLPNPLQELAKRFDTRERINFSPVQGPPKLSNSPYAIATALSNFLWGNGRTMSVDISTLSLQFIQAGNIPGFSDRMNAIGNPGRHNLTFSFPYNTASSNVFMPYILGNITLQLDGTFTRNATGSWSFEGVVRAQAPDLYDFNASTHRSKTNEDLTTIGRWMGERFNGVPYKIEINGETAVKF